MKKKNNNRLFNKISLVYGWFFRKQKRNFKKVFRKTNKDIFLNDYKSVLDIGCGTGALCSAFYEEGFSVTGVDSAEKMLFVAKRKTKGQDIDFVLGNVILGLDFPDDSFDIVIASHVAHGLALENRKKLYLEMARLAKQVVIIHDYNEVRNIGISIIEKLEGGDYFNFIKEAKKEMTECLAKNDKKFISELKVIRVEKNACWYLCEVKKISQI